jgi:hypothetical protein
MLPCFQLRAQYHQFPKVSLNPEQNFFRFPRAILPTYERLIVQAPPDADRAPDGGTSPFSIDVPDHRGRIDRRCPQRLPDRVAERYIGGKGRGESVPGAGRADDLRPDRRGEEDFLGRCNESAPRAVSNDHVLKLAM